MNRQGRAAVVDVGDERSGDRAGLDIAVVGGDVDRCLDVADVDVAVVRDDGIDCARRDGDDEIGPCAFEGWDAELEVAVGIGDRRGEALGLIGRRLSRSGCRPPCAA